MSDAQLDAEEGNNLRAVYQELCTSYHAIDDFRTKLLGLLPLATGAGIFLLVIDEKKLDLAEKYFWYIGAFGFVVTLGLLFYELYGIKKCTRLIEAGRRLEERLSDYKYDGQFITRPHGVAGLINEPLAAGVIYPAVLAAWTFVALVYKPCVADAKLWAILVFIFGFGAVFFYNLFLMRKDIKRLYIRISDYLKRLFKLPVNTMVAKMTEKQGQYLSFISQYMKVNGRSPAESDIQRYFRVTPPTVHQMVVKLESLGLISRKPGVARSIEVLASPDDIPELK